MKKILVPIDFSTYSQNALKLAAYMAKVKGMKLKLLHIIEEPDIQMGNFPFFKKSNVEYMSEIEQHTTEHLKRLASLVGTDGLNAEYEVRRSKKGIVKELVNETCDVIVMGRRREENDEVFFFGSTAEKVVRLSPVPVITTGNLKEGYQFKNIVYASDFEDEEQAPIIQRVFDLATIFNAQIHFLFVALNRDFLNEGRTRERLEHRAAKFDLKGHDIEMYVAETQEEGINEFIKETGADLLALSTHGRSGMVNFFAGSVAENMAVYASVPVLTYNINKKKAERSTKPITRERIVLRNKSGEKSGNRPL